MHWGLRERRMSSRLHHSVAVTDTFQFDFTSHSTWFSTSFGKFLHSTHYRIFGADHWALIVFLCQRDQEVYNDTHRIQDRYRPLLYSQC